MGNMDNAGTQNQQNSGNPAGIYSQQPTPGSAPATNSSTGFFPHPRPDFKSVAPVGDIVLTPNMAKKKSKKPLIIVGLAVIVAILFAILFIILRGTISSNSFNEQSFKEITREYMSYVMTGDANAGISRNNSSLAFLDSKVYEAFYNINGKMAAEERLKFFEDAQGILDRMLNVIGDAGSDNDLVTSSKEEVNGEDSVKKDKAEMPDYRLSLIAEKTKSNKIQLSTISNYLVTAPVYETAIINEYLNGTSATTLQVNFARDYDGLSKTNGLGVKEYVALQEQTLKNAIAIVDIYSNANCVSGMEFVTDCLNDEDSARVDELIRDDDQKYLESLDLVEGFVKDYFNTAREIYYLVDAEEIEQ